MRLAGPLGRRSQPLYLAGLGFSSHTALQSWKVLLRWPQEGRKCFYGNGSLVGKHGDKPAAFQKVLQQSWHEGVWGACSKGGA